MKKGDDLIELIDLLAQIMEDEGVPRNIKEKIKKAIEALEDRSKDIKIKINRALQELDEISDDPSLPSYIRPQLWNIASSLESL